jgi:hypothetical protein
MIREKSLIIWLIGRQFVNDQIYEGMDTTYVCAITVKPVLRGHAWVKLTL